MQFYTFLESFYFLYNFIYKIQFLIFCFSFSQMKILLEILGKYCMNLNDVLAKSVCVCCCVEWFTEECLVCDLLFFFRWRSAPTSVVIAFFFFKSPAGWPLVKQHKVCVQDVECFWSPVHPCHTGRAQWNSHLLNNLNSNALCLKCFFSSFSFFACLVFNPVKELKLTLN